jgi:hypothetical protein
MRVVAFDIGRLNFAFAVVETDPVRFLASGVSIPPRGSRCVRSNNNAATPEAVMAWREIARCSCVVDMQNHAIGKTTDPFPDVVKRLSSLLFSLTPEWDACTHVLIEQQMGARHASNIACLKIAQHVYAFFLHFFPEKNLIEYPAYMKTQAMGAPLKISKSDRKKWAVEKCREFIKWTGEEHGDRMTAFRKKDDVSDCVLMCFAFITDLLAEP